MADDPDAHRPVLERNQPAPAVVQPAGGDIAFIHAGEPGDAFKMAEHRGTSVLLAPVLSTQLTGQKGVAAAGIDHEAGLPSGREALPVFRMDQRSLTGTKVDPERVDTFVKADAFGDRI